MSGPRIPNDDRPVWTARPLVTGAAIVLVLAGLVPAATALDDPSDATHRLVVGVHEVPQGLAVGDDYHGATVVAVDPHVGFLAVRTGSPEAVRDRAAEDDAVRYVEEDRTDWLASDPLSVLQYGPQQIRATDAHAEGATGSAVDVCIVDTGIRTTHEDLAAGWRNGIDIADDDDDPSDADGHGTHVAGIATARFGNGVGIHGTSLADIYVAKVFSDAGGGASHSDMAEAFDWCAHNTGPRTIISYSAGGSDSQTKREGVQHAYDHGALIVAAAGNDGPCTDCIHFPAAYPEVVAVTCTERKNLTDDGRSQCSFSSQGPGAELAAPGSAVLSTCFHHDRNYCPKSGTSMSTPFVTGTAALAWSEAPSLSRDEIRQRLQETARDLGPEGRDNVYGFGEVDALCAVRGQPHPCDGG